MSSHAHDYSDRRAPSTGAAEYWDGGGTHTGVYSHACRNCQAEFIAGARYCHACGEDREGRGRGGASKVLDFPRMRSSAAEWLRSARGAVGLNTAAFSLLVAGVFCLVGALLTGIVFQPQTVLDWQAVQSWRSQWLLGAIAAFAAGVLLKRDS